MFHTLTQSFDVIKRVDESLINHRKKDLWADVSSVRELALGSNEMLETLARQSFLRWTISLSSLNSFDDTNFRLSLPTYASLHDRRFMSQAGRTRYFARSATRARSARRGGVLSLAERETRGRELPLVSRFALVSRSARNIAFAPLGS